MRERGLEAWSASDAGTEIEFRAGAGLAYPDADMDRWSRWRELARKIFGRDDTARSTA